MTEQELHMESERLIEEARREIEAIKQALEANRQLPHAAPGTMPAAAQDKTGTRTN